MPRIWPRCSCRYSSLSYAWPRRVARDSKPPTVRRWLISNRIDSARSMATSASFASSYPTAAILPAAPIRLRSTALRSTMRP